MRMAVGLSRRRTSALAGSVTRSASRRVLAVVDFFRDETEFSQHLLVRDGLVVLQPLAGFIERPFLFRRERLVIDGGVGDGAGDEIEHGLDQADDGCHLIRRQAFD